MVLIIFSWQTHVIQHFEVSGGCDPLARVDGRVDPVCLAVRARVRGSDLAQRQARQIRYPFNYYPFPSISRCKTQDHDNSTNGVARAL